MNNYIKYYIKYSTSQITNDNEFNNASGVEKYSWSNKNYVSQVVSGLTAKETYYFAIKAEDRFGNKSEMSNTVSHIAYAYPPTVSASIENNITGITPYKFFALTFSTGMDTQSVLNNLNITIRG